MAKNGKNGRGFSEDELADLLGLTSRQVRRLVEAKVLSGRDGVFDPVESARQYIRHVRHDHDGREARAELSRRQAEHKKLQTRMMVGQMPTSDELQKLTDELWQQVWATWAATVSQIYYAVKPYATGLPEHQYRGVIGDADQFGKALLRELRERWSRRLAGMKTDLADERRIDRVLERLAAGD